MGSQCRVPTQATHQNVFQEYWQKYHKCSPRETAKYGAKATNNYHEEYQKRFLDSKSFTNLCRTKIDTKKERAGYTDKETRYSKGGKFSTQGVNTDNFSSYVHISDRRPFPSQRSTCHVSRSNSCKRQKNQTYEIFCPGLSIGACHKIPKYRAIRRIDLS